MDLKQANDIAQYVKAMLSPFCEKVEIAGSIRRRRPFPHDVDIVAIPANQGQFITTLQGLGKIKVGGQKLIRCQLPQCSLDVYVASPETWATLLLIRTGSKASNIRLCSLAKSRNMTLHADGSGLFKWGARTIYGPEAEGEDERIAGDTERSIFEALGLDWKKPEDRE